MIDVSQLERQQRHTAELVREANEAEALRNQKIKEADANPGRGLEVMIPGAEGVRTTRRRADRAVEALAGIQETYDREEAARELSRRARAREEGRHAATVTTLERDLAASRARTRESMEAVRLSVATLLESVAEYGQVIERARVELDGLGLTLLEERTGASFDTGSARDAVRVHGATHRILNDYDVLLGLIRSTLDFHFGNAARLMGLPQKPNHAISALLEE